MFWQAGDTDLQRHSRRNLFLPKDAWLGQRLLVPESCWYFLPHSELSLAPHPSEDQVLSSLFNNCRSTPCNKDQMSIWLWEKLSFPSSNWEWLTSYTHSMKDMSKIFFHWLNGILKSFHNLFQCFNKNIVSQASLFLRKIAPFLSFLQLFTELYESKNSSALSGKEFKEYVLPHHTCSFLMWERIKQ